MILKKAELRNIKSYYPEEIINFDDKINLFVGPNAGGKSNLFETIQGILSNLLFRHVVLPPNPNRRNPNSQDNKLVYALRFDPIDQVNIQNNILDRHFSHSTEPASVYLTFKITTKDISYLNELKANREYILQELTENVAEVSELVNLIGQLNENVDFNFLKNKEIKLSIFPHESLDIHVADYSNFPEDKHQIIDLFFELTRYLNAIFEISIIFPRIQFSPLLRYFGPHRQIEQPQGVTPIDLSTIGSFEDSYTKGTNITKESTPSLISNSQIKLCQLKELGKTTIVNKYKRYLKKYLNLDVIVEKLEGLMFHTEYEVEYKRTNGTIMKLSSGEKEFFNLIAGLILSGINNGIVLIDEPELHLHPQWQQAILDLILELSAEFRIQFFIVTHSPKLISEKTLPNLFRVYKPDLYSDIVRPDDLSSISESKDLIQFLNSTNNEKIFFAEKVILVEGVSDQIIFSDIIQKLKKNIGSDTEVELLPVNSKNNLLTFRKILNKWEIDNYIIADLDYIKEIKKDRNLMFDNEPIKQKIMDNEAEIISIVEFSEKKLNAILCKGATEDGQTIAWLIKNKSKLSQEEFFKKFDDLSDYLIKDRAIDLKKNLKLSRKMIYLFKKLSKQNKILLLEKGEIEDYYHLSGNKVQNALEVIKTLNIRRLDPKIKQFLLRILS